MPGRREGRLKLPLKLKWMRTGDDESTMHLLCLHAVQKPSQTQPRVVTPAPQHMPLRPVRTCAQPSLSHCPPTLRSGQPWTWMCWLGAIPLLWSHMCLFHVTVVLSSLEGKLPAGRNCLQTSFTSPEFSLTNLSERMTDCLLCSLV